MSSIPFTSQNCVFQASRKLSEMKHISPLGLGKWNSVGEVKPQLLPEEIHSPDQNQLSPEEIHSPDQDQLPSKETHLPGQDQQEAVEDVAVDGECIDTSGLFRIWSICWARGVRLEDQEEKELELKTKNADISQDTKPQDN